jgi:PTS system fructose-specific IIA component/PTS system nitrogen regulatory IIA component
MGTAVATGMADGDGPPAVDIPAAADTPEAVVRFLAGWLVADGQLPAAELEPVVGRVLRREALGSTGIGRGLAVPHTHSEAITRVAFVAGRLAAPLGWSAIDGEPVRVLALVVGAGSGTPAAIRALEEAVRRLRGGGPGLG